MLDRAQWRLGVALGVSLLLHGWFVHTAPGLQTLRVLSVPQVPRAVIGIQPITVLFHQPSANVLGTAGTEGVARVNPIIRSEPAFVIDAVAALRSGAPQVMAPSAAPVVNDARQVTLPQARDPTYYSALSLDVYPKATTDLDLRAHLGLATGDYAKGQVRATVLIDEAGTVNEVRAIQAPASEIESAARTLLLQTRFTPARKDGRIVKAQVQISLDYNAP